MPINIEQYTKKRGLQEVIHLEFPKEKQEEILAWAIDNGFAPSFVGPIFIREGNLVKESEVYDSLTATRDVESTPEEERLRDRYLRYSEVVEQLFKGLRPSFPKTAFQAGYIYVVDWARSKTDQTSIKVEEIVKVEGETVILKEGITDLDTMASITLAQFCKGNKDGK